jgi:hypothetical protein
MSTIDISSIDPRVKEAIRQRLRQKITERVTARAGGGDSLTAQIGAAFEADAQRQYQPKPDPSMLAGAEPSVRHAPPLSFLVGEAAKGGVSDQLRLATHLARQVTPPADRSIMGEAGSQLVGGGMDLLQQGASAAGMVGLPTEPLVEGVELAKVGYQPSPGPQYGARSIVGSVARAAPQVGFAAAVGAGLPGGAAAQAGGFTLASAAPVMGSVYQEAIRTHGDPSRARLEAITAGYATATTSAVPGFAIFAKTPVGQASLRRAVLSHAAQIGEAAVAEGGQEVVESIAQEAIRGSIRHDPDTFNSDYWRGLGMEAIVGGILGGGARAATAPFAGAPLEAADAEAAARPPVGTVPLLPGTEPQVEAPAVISGGPQTEQTAQTPTADQTTPAPMSRGERYSTARMYASRSLRADPDIDSQTRHDVATRVAMRFRDSTDEVTPEAVDAAVREARGSVAPAAADVPAGEPAPLAASDEAGVPHDATEVLDGDVSGLVDDDAGSHVESPEDRFARLNAQMRFQSQVRAATERPVVPPARVVEPPTEGVVPADDARPGSDGVDPATAVVASKSTNANEHVPSLPSPFKMKNDALRAEIKAAAELEGVDTLPRKDLIAAVKQLREGAVKKAAMPPKSGKQPWEMTRAEYVNENSLIPAMRDTQTGKVYVGKRTDIHATIETPTDAGSLESAWVDNDGNFVSYAEAAKIQGQSDSKRTWRGLNERHQAEVSIAVAEGRPVPPSVLADYPDLIRTPAASSAPRETGDSAATPAATTPAPPTKEGEAVSVSFMRPPPKAVRDQLKAAGFRWNPDAKQWQAPDNESARKTKADVEAGRDAARGAAQTERAEAAPAGAADKSKVTATKLRVIAAAAKRQAEQKMGSSYVQSANTARQARIGDSVRKDAEKMEMAARAALRMAEEHEAGTIPESLAKITTRAAIDQLIMRLGSASMPTPTVSATEVGNLINAAEGVRGTKELIARARHFRYADGDKNWLPVWSQADRDAIKELAKIALEKKGHKSSWLGIDNFKDYERLVEAGISTLEKYDEARRLIKEYGSGERPNPRKARIQEALRPLIGRSQIGIDFFPTPPELATRVVEAAGIESGMKVLEPSAGTGNIADAAKEAGADVDVVEVSGELRKVLEAKDFTPVADNFLEYKPGEVYDRVVMNPPFSDSLDSQHVQHAYSMLKPGGRLVAIMSEGSFFRTDKKATAFREWMEELGGVSEKLPEGSFNVAQGGLPRTGTATRIVTIDKPTVTTAPVAEPEKAGSGDGDSIDAVAAAMGPAGKQYARMKRQHPDVLLLFRIGDFYEAFGEDAKKLHKDVGLTLTQRTAGVPMAGLPFHQLETYLRRLIEKGHRVAVAEQVNGEEAKGRQVTRVVTPGTMVDEATVAPADSEAKNETRASAVAPVGTVEFEELRSATGFGSRVRKATAAILRGDKTYSRIEIVKSDRNDEWELMVRGEDKVTKFGTQSISKATWDTLGTVSGNLKDAKKAAERILTGDLDPKAEAHDAIEPYRPMPTTIASAWRGNMAGESTKYVTDGTMLIPTSAISEKNAASLRGKDNPSRAMPDSAMDEVLERAADNKKNKPIEVVGIYRGINGPRVIGERDGNAVEIDGEKYELLKTLTGFDSITSAGPTQPVVMRKDGKVVAVLMPINRKEHFDLKIAKANLQKKTTAAPSKLDTIAANAADRIKKRKAPRGKNAGATTLLPDLIDAGVYVAAKAASLGVKSGKKLYDIARDAAKSFGLAADSYKRIGRIAKALMRDAGDTEDGFERAVDAAYADAEAWMDRRREGVKKRVNEQTGAKREEAKTVTEKKALSGAYRAAAQAAAAADRDRAAVARAQLRTLRDDMQDKLRQTRLRDDIKARSRQAASEDRLKAAKAIADGARAEAVRILEDNAPQVIKGKYLAAVRDATSIGKVAAIINRLRRDLVLWEARKLVKAAAGKTLPTKLRELEPEMRADALAARAAIELARDILINPAVRAKTSTDALEAARDELLRALNTITGLLHMQKGLDKVRIKGQIVEAAEMRAKVLERLIDSKELPEPASDEAPEPGKLVRVMRDRTNWESMSRMVDAFKPGGPAMTMFHEALRGRRRALRLHHDFMDKLGTVVSNHGFKSVGHFLAELSGTLGSKAQKHVDVEFGPHKRLTLGQAAYIYASSKDVGFRARIAANQPVQFREDATSNPIHLTQADLDRVEAAIPANVRAAIDEAKAMYDGHFFEQLSAVNKRLKGFHLEKVLGYWGIKLNRNYSEGKGTPFNWRRQVIRAMEESGYMQERLGPSKTPILIGDFGTDLVLRSRSSSTVIGKAETTKLMSRVLLHPEVQTRISRLFGQSTVERLERRLSLYSGGDMFQEADEKILRKVMSLWARGKTQLWFWTWLRNGLAGPPRLLQDIPAGAIAKGEAKAIWSPVQTFNDLRRYSPELRERWDGGGLGSFYHGSGAHVSSATLKEASLASLSQALEAVNKAARLNKADVVRAAGGLGKAWESVLDALTIGNYFDAMPAMVAYHHFLSVAPSNLSEEAKKTWAARHATRVFERSGNTATVEYANDIQIGARDSLLLASFIPFTGDTAKAQNILYEAFHGKDKKKRRRAVIGIATGIIMSSAVTALRLAVLGEDDDEVKTAAAKRAMQELISLLPGGTVLSRLAAGGVSGAPELETPFTDLANAGLAIAEDLLDAAERSDDAPKKGKLTSGDKLLKAAERALHLAGAASGVPTQYLREVEKAWRNWVGGED